MMARTMLVFVRKFQNRKFQNRKFKKIIIIKFLHKKGYFDIFERGN